MKTFILLLAIFALVATGSFIPEQNCECVPGQPLCASNFKTYDSECSMNCDSKRTGGYLFKLYDGPCKT
ncbi:unnamed protein product [Colias eurytheme]|nr:unnamed protein product [Colias eurytheme]